MSQDANQQAMDFWYNYDNFFLWKATPEVSGQIQRLFSGGETRIYHEFFTSVKSGTFPDAFKQLVEPHRDDLNSLFDEQDQLLQAAFQGSAQAQQRAFELFGQGTLYDIRREDPSYRFWPIHAMDADYSQQQPPIGYYTWYSFLRAYTLLNNIETGKWLTLGTHIALGAAVQQFMQPKQITGGVHTNPDNPPIPEDQLQIYRQRYLGMNFDQLDQAFTSDDELGPRPLPTKFAV